MASQPEKVLELVVFKLGDGVSREQFLGTVDEVSRWISRRPGFISRELSYDSDGDRWIEVIWWKSMDEAQAAAELAMTSESCAPMFAVIDMASTLMLHGALVSPPVAAVPA